MPRNIREIPGHPGKTFENITGSSFIHISVCTNVAPELVAAVTNMMEPTGIRSGWELSKNPTFSGGQDNPCDCPDGNGCRHYLLTC